MLATLQTIADVESATLASIEANAQGVFQYLKTVPLDALASQPLNSGQLAAIMTGFNPYASRFGELAETAAFLDGRGQPEARRRLDAMIPDFLKAQALYREMYNDRLGLERGHAAIFAEANRFVQKTLLAATEDSNRRFEVQHQALQDVMNGNCFLCHRYIGIPGGGYHLECARRLVREAQGA